MQVFHGCGGFDGLHFVGSALGLRFVGQVLLLLLLYSAALLVTRRASPVRRTVTDCSCRATLSLVTRGGPTAPLLLRGNGTLHDLKLGTRTLSACRRVVNGSDAGAHTLVRTTRYYHALTGCGRTSTCCRGILSLAPRGGCMHVRCVGLLLTRRGFHRTLNRDDLVARGSDSTVTLRLRTRDFRNVGRLLPTTNYCCGVRRGCPTSCLTTTGLKTVGVTTSCCSRTVRTARGCQGVSAAGVTIGHRGTLTCYLGRSCPATVHHCRCLMGRKSDAFRAYCCLNVDCCTVRECCRTRSFLRTTQGCSPRGMGLLCCLKHSYTGAS